jgi:hypothetical protein
MTKWLWTAALAAALLVSAATPAAAEEIRWGFWYGFAGVAPADGDTSLKFGTGTMDELGGSAVRFGGFDTAGHDADVPTEHAGLGSIVLAAFDPIGFGVGWADFALADSPQALGATNRFRGTFQLMDMASREVATLTFSGTLTDRGLSMFPAVTITGGASQSVALGGNRYDVGFSYEAIEGGGTFSFSVNGISPEGTQTPEPSSLALAGLGLAGAGLRAWRKRRLFCRSGSA